ncbi:MAG: cysteine desulfurase family protein [Cyanobacteria bacterium P01_H01_bin.15]
MQIYLDHSATTPPRPEALETFQKISAQSWGNPSSLHSWGERSATALEIARFQVANLIGCSDPRCLLFTASGTEADNLAILGVAQRFKTPQHLIISSVEHPAIAKPAEILESQGWSVTRLPVTETGLVTTESLAAAIRPETVLVSIIYGQSEVGSLQPIQELGQVARDHGILFHTDAVQVAGRLPVNVDRLPVDLLSLSAHKLYGVPGAGALFIRPGVELVPHTYGGEQENGLRSGTPAVPIIAAFGTAAELAQQELITECDRLAKLRDRLFQKLANCLFLKPTGDHNSRLPHHLSFVVKIPENADSTGLLSGQTLVRQMNLAGIAISAGSACASGKSTPSPILSAMGYADADALRGIRLTLGRETTTADIDWTALVLPQVLERILGVPSPSPSLALSI